MKSDLEALGIFPGGGVIASEEQPGRRGLVMSRLLAGVSRSAPALLCSLLAHGLLFLVCAGGWRLHGQSNAPSEVISVFTVVEEHPLGDTKPLDEAVRRQAPAPHPQVIRNARQTMEIRQKDEVGAQARHRAVEASVAPVSAPVSSASGKSADAPSVENAGAQEGMSRQAGDEPAGLPQTTGSPREASGGASTGEVLATPLYRLNPLPPYPRLARRLGQEGVVLLEVEVSAAGLVDDLRFFVSSGHEALDAAALEAVRSWRFSVGRRNGQPVAMRVRVPVRFSLRNME